MAAHKWFHFAVDPNPPGEGSPLSPFTVSPDSHPVDFAVFSSEEEPKMTNAGIWSMYNVQAEKHDKQLAERWIGQTRCTLNFAGLFSIVVAAFMVGTDLHKRDSTELLLAQIYLQISGQIINATPLLDIGPLRPNSLAIAVQTLWSLSLILSLACALGAILVQEWCQEYLRYSQCHPQPSTRARIRTYLFNGARNYHMEQVVTALPLFLHLAILLFCAGLVTYFFTLHKVVAYTALAAYSITGALYLFFTILPLVDTSSPFKTPISTFLWHSLKLIQLAILYALRWMMSLVSSESPFFRFRLPKIIKARRERYREGFIRALKLDLESVGPERRRSCPALGGFKLGR
ncbi:hypothetical protein EDB84DRAFT_211305 [Lactarius hengduanensis]|nr:hypothetical protein EDB84DRAFT_211305 [Lactarius hengduanensis]